MCNENKIRDTDNLSSYVVPRCLSKPVDSKYEVEPEMAPSDIRRELKKNGFIENHEVAGL